jgi:Cys-rich repeat protein
VGRGATCVNGPQGVPQCMRFCENDAGCPSGAVCQAGFCLYQCAQDDDCPVGLRCDSGICQAIL